MARTAKEFFDRTLGNHIWSRRNRPEKYWEINAGSPPDNLQVPVLGQIVDMSYQEMEDGEVVELDRNQIEFYLVDRNGCEYRLDDSGLDKLMPIFEKLKTMGVQKPGLAHGDGKVQRKKPHEDHHDEYGWRFLHLPEQVVRRLHVEDGFAIVADQWSRRFGNQSDRASRMIYPDSIRVKQAADVFDVGSAEMRFVRYHRNCGEYRTKNGASVFDHRTVDHSMHQSTVNNLWRISFRRYVNQFRPQEEQKDRAKSFAYKLLHNLAGSDDGYGITPEQKSHLVYEALAVFGQSAYVPVSILMNSDVYKLEVRKVYRDRNWGENDWVGENVFNPIYVVISDKEEAKASVPPKEKGVLASVSFRFADMRMV